MLKSHRFRRVSVGNRVDVEAARSARTLPAQPRVALPKVGGVDLSPTDKVLFVTIATSWQPLSKRLGIAGVRPVPANLRHGLRDWIWSVSVQPYRYTERIINRLNLRFEIDDVPEPAEPNIEGDPMRAVAMSSAANQHARLLQSGLAYNTSDRRVVEIVDVLLDLLPPSRDPAAMGRFRRAFYNDHHLE